MQSYRQCPLLTKRKLKKNPEFSLSFSQQVACLRGYSRMLKLIYCAEKKVFWNKNRLHFDETSPKWVCCTKLRMFLSLLHCQTFCGDFVGMSCQAFVARTEFQSEVSLESRPIQYSRKVNEREDDWESSQLQLLV